MKRRKTSNGISANLSVDAARSQQDWIFAERFLFKNYPQQESSGKKPSDRRPLCQASSSDQEKYQISGSPAKSAPLYLVKQVRQRYVSSKKCFLQVILADIFLLKPSFTVLKTLKLIPRDRYRGHHPNRCAGFPRSLFQSCNLMRMGKISEMQLVGTNHSVYLTMFT